MTIRTQSHRSKQHPKLQEWKEPRRVVKRKFVEQSPANSEDEEFLEEEEIEKRKAEAEAVAARRQAMIEAQPLKYEAAWRNIIEFFLYLRDEDRLTKPDGCGRQSDTKKNYKQSFFFPWSKRKIKMMKFVEKEKKSWYRAEKKDKKKKKKLKGKAKMVGKLINGLKDKSKKKKKKKTKGDKADATPTNGEEKGK